MNLITTANNIKTTHARLMKLARANRDTFLYKHSGITTPIVTKKTVPSRTEPIDVLHIGKKRIKTLDIVSPTTTLYDIIAVNFQIELQPFIIFC